MLASAVLYGSGALADVPRILSQPAYQSPVSAEPDDLLMLPGDGFSADDSVVYRAVGDSTQPLATPEALPPATNSQTGTAPVVSTADVPHSLTVRLPVSMTSGQTYALWVRTRSGEWSNGVLINDARPMWFSPSYIFQKDELAGLPRELKIIGRNLRSAPGASTLVRITGPQALTIQAKPEKEAYSGLDQYVAKIQLPPILQAGDYRISLSRDGLSWLDLPDTFTVRPDPKRPAEYSPSDAAYGGCHPSDGLDDSACILRAIDAAKSAGDGIVTLGAGTWDLIDSHINGKESRSGIIIPEGVSLIGKGSGQTRVLRHASWTLAGIEPAFSLIGNNTVKGIEFQDQEIYAASDGGAPALQLGKRYELIDPRDGLARRSVEDVIITENIFDKVFVAIQDAGLPIKRLIVSRNVLGAFHADLEIGGDRLNMIDKFRVDDSVVAYNTFKPGSYINTGIGQGVIASETGASYHLDFSHNIADGASTDYLYSSDDPKGWRAGFFFHMHNNHEMSLISQNVASCTGDKAGDGEAISYDDNGNTFAFEEARTVLRSTPTTVTIAGPLLDKQYGDVPVPLASYYLGHWIQVGQGRGLGQVRKIVAYQIDPHTSNVSFTIAPAWDVEPRAGESRINVGREFWQVYMLDNVVDQRKPLCQKSNRNKQQAGLISIWAQTADSVVAGNQQYDTDGITFQNSYTAFYQSFLRISNNTIDGELEWESDCSHSGIQGFVSAAPTAGTAPTTVSYGVSIDHNTIIHADGLKGGAISLPLTWFDGPPPHDWQLIDNTLIHHNLIKDVGGPPARSSCVKNFATRRSGINLSASSLNWNSVLYANSCSKVTFPLSGDGRKLVRVCPSSVPEDCECR